MWQAYVKGSWLDESESELGLVGGSFYVWVKQRIHVGVTWAFSGGLASRETLLCFSVWLRHVQVTKLDQVRLIYPPSSET